MSHRACCIALVALLLAGAAAAATPLPAVERAASGPCVAEPARMRREHMDLLRHQRDLTVHQGVRGAAVSLQACVSCHASPASGSVAQAPGDFCVACHSYAAVQIDCFECHASRPASALARLP